MGSILVATEVLGHLQSTAVVPLRKVLDLQMLIGHCNELASCPGVYPASAHMQLK